MKIAKIAQDDGFREALEESIRRDEADRAAHMKAIETNPARGIPRDQPDFAFLEDASLGLQDPPKGLPLHVKIMGLQDLPHGTHSLSAGRSAFNHPTSWYITPDGRVYEHDRSMSHGGHSDLTLRYVAKWFDGVKDAPKSGWTGYGNKDAVCPGCGNPIDEDEANDPQYEVEVVDGQRWHRKCLDEDKRVNRMEDEAAIARDPQEELPSDLQAGSLWQMPRFAAPGKPYVPHPKAGLIGPGPRMCRVCGQSVQNEHDFSSQGLRCRECYRAGYNGPKDRDAAMGKGIPAEPMVPPVKRSLPYAATAGSLWELKKVSGTAPDVKCKGCGNYGIPNGRCRSCGKWIPGKPISSYEGSWAQTEEKRRKGEDVPPLPRHNRLPSEGPFRYPARAGKQAQAKVKYLVEGIERVRDVFFADGEEQAKMLFKAKYPAATPDVCMTLDDWNKTAQAIPADGIADGGTPYTDEEMDLMEGKPGNDDKVPRRRTVRVRFADGNEITTGINGTKAEVQSYYLDNEFELDENKPPVRGVDVEFLD